MPVLDRWLQRGLLNSEFESGLGWVNKLGGGAGQRIGFDPIAEVNEPTDQIPGNTSTPFSIAIGGQDTGVVNFLGDRDWFSVTLTAGEVYIFTLTGSGGGPLSDPYLVLYSSAGVQIALNDDADWPNDLNSVLTFTPATTGTYYLGAQAFNDSVTGGYTLTAAVSTPLDSINWMQTMATTSIDVYFATAGQMFNGETALRGWTTAEVNAAMAALNTFAQFTTLTFNQVFSPTGAEMVLSLADVGEGVLGYFQVGTPYGFFNPNEVGWDATGLQQGGYGFVTLIHELGHGLGLAHPHDTGGSSTIMPGVTGPFDSYGDHGLNQGVFTTMSYNDGWPGRPGGALPSVNGLGWQGTPMALDVGMLQQFYGVNPNASPGDTVYTMLSTDYLYRAIWDVGGIDTIVFPGVSGAHIDLRAATLQYETGGGGWISYAHGIHGGFTIANGVVIENATGGAGVDSLFGNDVDNALTGNAGDDNLHGFGGADTLLGGAGADLLDGGAGADAMTGGAGNDQYAVDDVNDLVTENAGEGEDRVTSSASYILPDNVEWLTLVGTATSGTGNGLANTIVGNDLGNTLHGGSGNDSMNSMAGDDLVDGGDGDDLILASRNTINGPESNTYIGGAGFDRLEFGSATTGVTINLLAGTVTGGGVAGTDTISGFEAVVGTGEADVIIGDANDNLIIFTGGDDSMDGGAGYDTLRFNSGSVSINLLTGTGSSVVSAFTLTGFEYFIGVTGAMGDGADNRFEGTSAADALSGGGGNDIIFGGAGQDDIDGGTGVDILMLSVSSSNATWTRHTDGTWTVFNSTDHTDSVANVEFLDFTDRDVFLDRAQRTFSGNGTSDVLFRRTDGIMASWEVTGTSINSASFLPTAPASWSVLGTGDISGDGRDDVIWQRSDGLVYSWTMNGGAVSGAVGIASVGAQWSFLGVGDFNGDLTDDLAWQRTDGLVYIWSMNGSAIQSANAVTALPAAWEIAGIGDFNGDGRDDFLWRNASTGQSVIWHMNGSAIQNSGATSEQATLDWAVIGVGDTNGDGRDDIILQRVSDGMIAVWAMDGTSVTSATDVAAANPSLWTIHNIGDYNGDGREDILWQHDNGLVYVWLMNGAAIQSAGALAGIGGDWGII